MKYESDAPSAGMMLALCCLARHRCGVLIAGVILLATIPVRADEQSAVTAFQKELATKSAEAEKASRSVLSGSDGWLFFVPELRALSVGPFWGENAKSTSRSTKTEYADPLPAILDFRDQLRSIKAELVLVPVPAKAAVYPEAISKTLVVPAGGIPPRIDTAQRDFYTLLKQEGVTVIDLLPLFLKHRHDSAGALYCKTDSHWSGAGVALAAQAIADELKDQDWLRMLTKETLHSNSRDVTLTGDLARLLNEQNPTRETLPLTFVGTGTELTPVSPSRQSPILLIGDSHTLVFHDPTLAARGAGLPDHLALRLGVAVDLVGVSGSGATTTRIELLRRKDNLQGKKLVIWCFSVREFTESTTGWRKVPIIRP